jgi:hypothetical protein
MKIWVGMTREGMSRLEPSPAVDQSSPRRSYVYGHCTEQGVLFYIGKGVGRRAWSADRHPLWHRYVERHLAGKYSVTILADDLSPEDAEEREADWISQEWSTLVNWINVGRKTDFKALDRCRNLRNANEELAATARVLEKSDAEQAITLYRQALANIESYARIQPEQGLLGQLIEEERHENGISGQLEVLDRVTLCLCRLNRGAEAAALANDYFEKYRADRKLAASERIIRRVAEAAPKGD